MVTNVATLQPARLFKMILYGVHLDAIVNACRV
jgi:hypothetical protein